MGRPLERLRDRNMLAQLDAALGTGGLAVLALFGTVSFLAWMPAIAGVVISERPLARKLPLFVALSLFPPISLVIMAVSIKKATPARPVKTEEPRRPGNAPQAAPVRAARPSAR